MRNIFLGVLLLGIIFNGMQLDAKEKQLYQCPMHPQIIRENPGNCPICGMKLVPIRKTQTPKQNPSPSSIQITPRQEQLMGIQVETVKVRNLHRSISATGTVAHDPELYLAIEEYRQTLQNQQSLKDASPETQKQMQALLQSSKLKLMHLGLNADVINQLATSDHSSLLMTHQGGRIWIYAQIYESETTLVKPGQRFEVSLPGNSSQKWQGLIASVDSYLDAETRTLKIRGQVSDPAHILHPDMYVDVRIQAPIGKRLAIPADAVFDTGTRQTVFVQKKTGEYENRPVKLGLRGDDAVEVLTGLKAGEKVAVNANFLLDSESKLKSTIEEHRH